MTSIRRTAPLAVLALVAACHSNAAAKPVHSAPPVRTVSGSSGSCHARGSTPANILPDPQCTPGAVNPSVTQANIYSTICVSGYTKKIRPPVAYTDRLKRQQMIAYGYPLSTIRGHEEDHLIALEDGGDSRSPQNLWPELGQSRNPKDVVEDAAHAAICSKRMTLAYVQHAMATNWIELGVRLGVHG